MFADWDWTPAGAVNDIINTRKISKKTLVAFLLMLGGLALALHHETSVTPTGNG